MAKDKKGKGSGSKDACYHKVKSRYSVWPSAYASGALVKCRKVGAANWGNSTKKEEFEGQVLENVGNEPKLKPGSGLGGGKTVYPKGQEPKPTGAKLPKIKKVTEGKHSKSETYVKGTAPVRATYGGKTESFPKETYKKKSKKVEVDEKYQGMYQSPAPTHNRLMSSDEKARMSPGRRAMAKSDELEKSEPGSKRAKAQKKAASQIARNFQSARATKEEVEMEGYKPIDKKKENEMYRRAGNLARTSLASKGKKKLEAAKKSAKIVSAISSQKENERFAKMADEKARDNYEEVSASVQRMLDEAGKKCWKGYKKAGTQKLFGKTYNRCVKANEELSIDQQMKISRDYNRMSPEEKKAANKKAMGNVKKVAPKKDTRTDAQKMTDAVGKPRMGSSD
jgi:hypothetical protein|tara:strand:+ start:2814 stop:3998 length:1185 start_codon:yes stop_codon:yes gene_type:complete